MNIPVEIIIYIGEISTMKNKLLLSTLCKRFHVIWNESIWEHLFVKKYQRTDSDESVRKFFNTSSWRTNYIIMHDSEYYLKKPISTSERNRETFTYYNNHYQIPLYGDIVKIEEESTKFMIVSLVSKDKSRKHKLFFGGLQVIEKNETNKSVSNEFYIKRENLVLTNNYVSYELYGRKYTPKYYICNPNLIY